MRRLAIVLALIGAVGSVEAKETSTFSASGEFRLRWFGEQAPNANKDALGNQNDEFLQRTKINLSYSATNKIGMNVTLLGASRWGHEVSTGDQSSGTGGVMDGTADAQNVMLVNQAYAYWMPSDSVYLQAGRGNAALADGSVLGKNDFEQIPYSYDSLLAMYTADSFVVGGWLNRFVENPRPTVDTGREDPQGQALGFWADLKGMPDAIKMVHFHVIKYKHDGSNLPNTDARSELFPYYNQNADSLRYGVTLGGEVAGIDYKATYAAQDAKAVVDPSVPWKGNMMQAEVGYTLKDVMKLRPYFKYHTDTGDDLTTTDKVESYITYYYDLHGNSGMMDVLAWGNLTFMSVGATLEPMDGMTAGIHYHMFSKSEKKGNATAGARGSFIAAANAGTDRTEDAIGNELDLVVTKTYAENFSMKAMLGMFMPGDWVKKNNGDKADTYNQLFVEAKMTF